MLAIDNELIKRVENGDLIVRGSSDDIRKHRFEDGWFVLGRTTRDMKSWRWNGPASPKSSSQFKSKK